MTDEKMDNLSLTLASGLREMGLALPDEQIERLRLFYRMICAENKKKTLLPSWKKKSLPLSIL